MFLTKTPRRFGITTHSRILSCCFALFLLFSIAACEKKLPVLDGIGGDFRMQSTEGGELQLSSLQGNPVLLFFGFTNCPDYCPITMQRIDHVLDQLGEKRAEVKVVFVGIDPEYDTPERLKHYLNFYNSSFIGLSGSQAQIDEALGLFKAVGYKQENGIFAHTTRVYLLDKKGRVRYMYSDKEDKKLLHDLNLLL